MSLESNAMDFLQKGFRVTLGATTSLVESLQDAQKRDENLAQLRQSPTAFTERLEQKGTEAELEARRLVDSMVSQYSSGAASPRRGATTPAATPTIDPDLERELRDLTAQLADCRSQLNRG